MAMEFPDLENFYETLAQTLDEVPEEKRMLFLSKLALLLANKLNDRQSAMAAIKTSLQNLD